MMKVEAIKALFNRHLNFRSSIYARVVLIIAMMSVFLFASFLVIFRSVHEEYLNTVIRQNGSNVGSIVEGALYHSMLTNDKSGLQNTLDVIHTMSGIDEVNMYDEENALVYSTFSSEIAEQGSPDCVSCHEDFTTMFPQLEKSYRIIDAKSSCNMNQTKEGYRQLLIRTPILNERSCYTSSCHAHQESEVLLGSLLIKIPLNEMDDALQNNTLRYFILSAVATIGLTLLLILFTRDRIKKPLKAIVDASEAVAKGDNTVRLVIRKNELEDIKVVSDAFNNMLDNIRAATLELRNWSHQLEYKIQKKSEELLEAQNELIQIEKIASLGKLSSSVAHEINNPLSGVLTYTKLVSKQLGKAEMDETTRQSVLKHLKVIETETKRCGEIVKGLLDFSRKDQEHFSNQNINNVLRETYNLMAHQMKIENIGFTSDFSALSDLVYCSENQIKQACIAILVNASEAVTDNGEVMIRTFNPDGENIRIEITDNGTGIAPEDIPHIFEPFFSAKNKASGIGLGLAIAHGLIVSHKGRIEVDSHLGKGTKISIVLPLLNNEGGSNVE
jgi:two-component system, NtrC family, sensor kinase